MTRDRNARSHRTNRRAATLTLVAAILGVLLMAKSSISDANEAEPARETGPVTTEELSHTRPANMFLLAEDNAPVICKPLLESVNRRLEGLNRPLEISMESRLYPFMRNDYLVQPWEDRRYLLRPNDNADPTINYWDAAFLDINGDGAEDALFRDTLSIGGNEFNSTYLVLSVDRAVKAEEPLSEIRARQIIRNHRLSYEEFDQSPHGSRQFVQLVRMNDRIFILIGRSLFWTLDDIPRKPKLQLLRLQGGGLQRVCLFDGAREIRLSR